MFSFAKHCFVVEVHHKKNEFNENGKYINGGIRYGGYYSK